MNIFIAKNGTRQGPYSPEQLKGIVGRGDVSMSDRAWYEGCAEWTRISELPELVEIILPALPSAAKPADTQSATSTPPSGTNATSQATPEPSRRPVMGVLCLAGSAVLVIGYFYFMYGQWQETEVNSLARVFGGVTDPPPSFRTYLWTKMSIVRMSPLGIAIVLVWQGLRFLNGESQPAGRDG